MQKKSYFIVLIARETFQKNNIIEAFNQEEAE
jgi:hypothetical protein